MNNTITLNEIKTVEQAKALAFDTIQRIEIEQNNLRALQVRIQELQNAEKVTETLAKGPVERGHRA